MRIAVLAVVGLLGWSGTAPAAETSGGGEPWAAKVDARSAAVLRAFSTYLAGLQSFRAELVTASCLQAEGLRQEYTTRFTLAAQRPERIAMLVRSGVMGTTLICDGRERTLYMPMTGKYAIEPAPGKPDLHQLPLVTGMGGNFPITKALLGDDPAATLLAEVQRGRYLGEEKLDGQPCHRLHFEQAEFQWDAWISTGAQPLLLQVVPDMNRLVAKTAGTGSLRGMKNLTYTMSFRLDHWELNGRLPPELFVFTPPEGAQRVASLFGAGGRKAAARHPLLGKPAPAFQLDRLAGERFDLAAHQGHVVVLTFWAGWNDACRKALPLLDKLAAGYQDRGVMLVAVNQDEPRDAVTAFLNAQPLGAGVVLLDPEAQVGARFGIEGLPQTIVLDKAGVVQAVHVGFDPVLRDELTRELDALLAGRPLTAPAAASRDDGVSLLRLQP